MNKQLKYELLSNLKKIKNNVHKHVIPSEQLVTVVDQLKEQRNVDSLQYVVESLAVAQKYSENGTKNKKNVFLTKQKIPFNEIIALLKDVFQGKLNDHLQEILDSAEIELTVNKKKPENLQSARQLEIKIKLAAAVIDKYADLLTMIIGEKSSKKNDDVIRQSYKTIKELNDKLDRVNLVYSIISLKNNCQIYIEEHEASHCCFSFFYSSKITKQVSTIEIIINDLIQPGLAVSEIIGGLLLLDSQINDIVEDKKTKTNLHTNIIHLLTSNNFPVNDKEIVSQMIIAYISRAKFLALQWPDPFVIEKSPASAANPPELRVSTT